MKFLPLLQKLRFFSFRSLVLTGIVSCVTTLFFSICVQAQPATTFNPYDTGKLIIGVRTDAYDIGNSVRASSSGGTCGVFGRELQKVLNDEDITVSYEPVYNNYHGGASIERYDGLRNNVIHVECGPNSRPSLVSPSWARNIDFSPTSFHKTGIKLLIRKSVVDDTLDKNGSVAELAGEVKVLVPERTTTKNILEKVVDLEVDPVSRRDEALDKLDDSYDYAYASDALIIQTLWNEGVPEVKDSAGNTTREFRADYKSKGYTIYPSDDTYLLEGSEGGGTEEYVIAIKDDTEYSERLMSAVERALSSGKMKQQADILEKAELFLSLSPVDLEPDRGMPLMPSMPSFGWTIFIVLFCLLAIFLLYCLIHSRAFQNSSFNRRRDYWQEPEARNNVNISINSSPINHMGDGPTQVVTREQELAEISADVRRILDSISTAQLSHRERQIRAAESGKLLTTQNPTLARRLSKAIGTGMISAIESSVDHPLASFFVDSFKDFRESGK